LAEVPGPTQDTEALQVLQAAMAPLPVLPLFSCGHVLECAVLVLAHLVSGLIMAPYQCIPWVGEAPLWWKVFFLACGIVVAPIDHAGMYILKLCPWFSLNLQDKIKQLLAPFIIGGLVFYFVSLGQQLGAAMAWKMFGVIAVVLIVVPSFLYIAFQKHKVENAEGHQLRSEETDASTPKISKHVSIGNLTGLNFAMDSATAVWDPNSTVIPSSHAQFQVAWTYLPFVLNHLYTDIGFAIFFVMCFTTMDVENRATLLKFYDFPVAFAQTAEL